MLKPDNSDHGNEPDLLKIHSSILDEAGFVECAYTLADSGLYANVTTLTAQIKEVGFSDPYQYLDGGIALRAELRAR